MEPERTEGILRQKYAEVSPILDERGRRLWAAAEAKALGRGGPSLVARPTGLSRSTIHAGLRELADGATALPASRVRRPGAGRKSLTDRQPRLLDALDALVEPTSRGDPQSPLRWACKSTRNLAGQLQQQGFQVGRQKVSELLRQLGYYAGVKVAH
jgi:Rhodopirellula transposase DDE domain